MDKLKINSIFFRLAKDPNRTDLIFSLVETVSRNPDPVVLKEIEDAVYSHDEMKRMYAERYMPKPPTIEELGKYTSGTFGNALHRHLTSNGLTLDLFPQVNINQRIDYVTARMYQDHDLWHALFGYSVEVEDELALQAFGMAQYKSPISAFLISAGLLHLLRNEPKRTARAIEKIVEGYLLGRQTKFMLTIKLHDLFDWPVTEVRRICALDTLPVSELKMEYGNVN